MALSIAIGYILRSLIVSLAPAFCCPVFCVLAPNQGILGGSIGRSFSYDYGELRLSQTAAASDAHPSLLAPRSKGLIRLLTSAGAPENLRWCLVIGGPWLAPMSFQADDLKLATSSTTRRYLQSSLRGARPPSVRAAVCPSSTQRYDWDGFLLHLLLSSHRSLTLSYLYHGPN